MQEVSGALRLPIRHLFYGMKNKAKKGPGKFLPSGILGIE
jgi:hypothetical protein